MKIKSKLTRYIALFMVAVGILPFCFCSPDIASGSEVGNPCVVTGRISDSSGNGVCGANLFLIDPLETNPPHDLTTGRLYSGNPFASGGDEKRVDYKKHQKNVFMYLISLIKQLTCSQ